jgi:hypothetical protein
MATIHKRSGKWEYRVSYKDPITGKYRNKTHGGYIRKADCEEAARKAWRWINPITLIFQKKTFYSPNILRNGLKRTN